MERILSYIKEKIETAIENGSIKPCDPELTAFVMLKLYIALIFDWENHPPLEKRRSPNCWKCMLVKDYLNNR